MSNFDLPSAVDMLLAYDWLARLAKRRDGTPAGEFYNTTLAQLEVEELIYTRDKSRRKQRARAGHHMWRAIKERKSQKRERWKHKEWRRILRDHNEGSY
jgi:hypothetical protein